MTDTLALTLPTDSAERKNYPLLHGLFRYFPAALAAVANVSKRGNDKHNPGEEMHHARGKSMDHGDCILRHTIDLEDLKAAYQREPRTDVGRKLGEDMVFEAAQRAWRALAELQELCEKHQGTPLAPGAKLPTLTYKGAELQQVWVEPKGVEPLKNSAMADALTFADSYRAQQSRTILGDPAT